MIPPFMPAVDGAGELQNKSEGSLTDMAESSTVNNGMSNKRVDMQQSGSSAHNSQDLNIQTSGATLDLLELEDPAITHDKMEGQRGEESEKSFIGTEPSQVQGVMYRDTSAPSMSVQNHGQQENIEKEQPQQPTTDSHITQSIEGLSIKDEKTGLEAERQRVTSLSPPPPPPKDQKFLNQRKGSASSAAEYDEKQALNESMIPSAQRDDDTRSEIQSIMGQFDDDSTSPELEKIMTPRLDVAQTGFHPPRSSSLDPTQSHVSSPILQRTQSRDSYMFSPSAVRPGSISGVSISSIPQQNRESTASPRPASTIFQPPPPSPDPEPALPFDFHRFLEQLRHRTADPVARFLRSFLTEFGKKQWMVHEQVKIISDFLEFIAKKMALCEVWRTVSDLEFDNAREGMEKLVMNRLYNQTFSPAIPPVEPVSPTKGRRNRSQAQSSHTQGRKGQHQEDVERDAVIAQKIRIYGWIREEHLDIPAVNDKGRKFLVLAQQELLKINSYRAPRDKVICVLNCCKVIFGFLKNSKGDQSADSFVPLLIYTVLRANPEHLVSNVQYILRFRNQEKLGGEAGYYISSLMGVVSFVENLDRTNLTVSDEEFERNVEASVSVIAEGHKAKEYESATHENATPGTAEVEPASPTKYQPHYSEKGAPSRPQLTPRNSTEGERAGPRRGNSTRQKAANVGSADEADEKDAVAGLLRTIQKPLSTIGRMFSDESNASSQGRSQHPALTPQPGSTPRLSPGLPSRPLQRKSSEESRRRQSPDQQQRARSAGAPRPDPHSEEDAAARQARAEVAEAQRIQAQEHKVVVETLQGMFPDLDREVISDVVRMKEGRVGLAVDACLALSN